MTERNIQNAIVMKHALMFRNNNGMGYVGGREIKGYKGFFVVNPRKIKYGLFPGSSDMIGLVPIIITQEMVGKQIAQFASIEIKTEHDKLSEKQLRWNRMVLRTGGLCQVWKEEKGRIIILEGDEIC
jgi:ribosomal protein S19